MPGNFSALQNITNLVALTQAVNTVSGNLLGNLMVIISWLVMFAVMKRFENSHAFAVSSFITAIIAILLKQLNIVSDQILLIAIFMAVISILLQFLKNE